MNDGTRLEHLRALLVRLEGMPASAEREWMLDEVRGRAVDVDTGAEPTAMRSLPGDRPEPALPAPPARPRPETAAVVPRPRRSRRRALRRSAWSTPPASPVIPRPRAAQEDVVDLLECGGVLCLDDESVAAEETGRPWSAGLRG